MSELIHKIIILGLLILSLNSYAQDSDVIGDAYMQSLLNTMNHKYEFRFDENKLNYLSFNYYDLKKANENNKSDSVLFKIDIPKRGKFVAGFGIYHKTENVKEKRLKNAQISNNQPLFVFLNPGTFIALRPILVENPTLLKIYNFESKSMIYNKEIPIALVIDNNANIDQQLLLKLLNFNEFNLIDKSIIEKINKSTNIFLIITYNLK